MVEWRRGLTFTEWIGGLICQNVWMSCHWPCFEMKKLRLCCSSDISFVRGAEMQSAGSRLSIWLTHRLSCGPGSWDLLCKGLGHPEYLPGALPVVTGVPDSPICFPGGVVDPVGWDYSWVPRALHLKCKSSLFFFVFFFTVEKNLRLNTEGVLTKRTDGSSEPLDDFHCDLGHLDSVLLLSRLEGVRS